MKYEEYEIQCYAEKSEERDKLVFKHKLGTRQGLARALLPLSQGGGVAESLELKFSPTPSQSAGVARLWSQSVCVPSKIENSLGAVKPV